MAKLSGSKIGSRTVRCGWAHHKKDAMQSIDYNTIDQVRSLLCTHVHRSAPLLTRLWATAAGHRLACSILFDDEY